MSIWLNINSKGERKKKMKTYFFSVIDLSSYKLKICALIYYVMPT